MPDEADSVGGRQHNVAAGMNVNLPGVDTAAKQIADLTNKVTGLNKALSDLSSKSSTLGSSISGMLGKITSATGGGAAGGGSGGGGYTNGGVRSSGTSFVGSMFGKVNENGWLRDLMMFPTRFMQDQITANRDLSMGASGALGMQAFGAGVGTPGMMTALAGNFGNVLGNPQDLLAMQQIGGKVGAGLDWRFYTPTGQMGPPSLNNQPRAAGFYRGVMEAQRMNPAAPVAELAGTIGGYTANVGAQQAGTFMTGGAFSMIKQGNQQKSISEWATGILKFLQNQRPGGQRGKPFTYGELMTQNFPGSNIDVWLNVNGVPEGMKDYFWTYAMAQSNAGTEDIFGAAYAPVASNVSFQRLQAGNAQTRSGFQLAGKLSGQYANKEQANRWFNELLGSMLGQILPQALSSATMSYVQYLPDAIQEMLMQLSERTTVGALGGAMMGWGSLFPGAGETMMGGANSLLSKMGIVPSGDVGDVGDYGPLGATTTAGLHPDMRKRVDAMMQANPRLRVTSGYRDLAKQQTLRRKGVGRVSGKPSAHTRGMAADMGPPSQYGWLVANARNFGLSSGMSHGEPWHVGLGDTEHVGEGITDLLSSVMGIFGGFGGLFTSNDPTQQISGVAGGTTQILKMLMALFGNKDTNAAQLEPRNVYSQLVGATQAALKQGIVLPARSSATGAPADTAAQDIIGGGQFPSSTPSGLMNDFKSSDTLTRGKAVVNALYAAGFRGQELKEMAAISYWESSWKKDSFLEKGGDMSYGLFALNRKPWLDQGKTPPFTKEEAFDPYRAAQIARLMYLNEPPYHGPGGKNTYKPWTTRDKPIDIGVQAVEAAGLGDIYDNYSMPMPVARGGDGPVFHNTFVIQTNGGGNTGGGIDVRRTASQLADQLETQMRQRLARTN